MNEINFRTKLNIIHMIFNYFPFFIMINRLCLGTAQFGMDYGITNTNGKINNKDINPILDLAFNKGIRMLDTAHGYGDAEKVLGRNLKSERPFKIFSKISINKNTDKKKVYKELNEKFENTLKRLNQTSIEGLFIHDSTLLSSNIRKQVIEWLISVQNKNKVKKIGVSIYELEDLRDIPLDIFQIIQIPCSLYDQRMLKNGALNLLVSKQISIHIRSIFLQGIILQNPENLPVSFSESFRKHHTKNFFCENHINKKRQIIKKTFDFISTLNNVEAILVGISNKNELKEILDIWDSHEYGKSNIQSYEKFAWQLKDDIDPRFWPKT